MTLNIRLSMDNEAFADDKAGNELANILRVFADQIADQSLPSFKGTKNNLRDSNGNTVGEAKFSTR